MKQSDSDWFRPLWRRVLVTAIAAIWCGLEWFVWQDEWFRWVALAVFGYAVWTLLIRFDDTPKLPGGDEP